MIISCAFTHLNPALKAQLHFLPRDACASARVPATALCLSVCLSQVCALSDCTKYNQQVQLLLGSHLVISIAEQVFKGIVRPRDPVNHTGHMPSTNQSHVN